jgi:hypothetical protein
MSVRACSVTAATIAGWAWPSQVGRALPADVAAKLLPESAYGNLHFPTGFDSFTKAMGAIATGWTAIASQ